MTKTSNNTKHDFLGHCLEIFAGMPFIENGIEIIKNSHGDYYQKNAQKNLELLFISLGRDWDKFDKAVADFVQLTLDTLRMQNEFLNNGTVAKYSIEDRLDKVYNNAELMQGPYLTGLYLAHVFWPNHFAKVKFFRSNFLPQLKADGQLIDIGAGPGTFTMYCSTQRPDINIVATDISPYSQPMVEKLLDAARKTGMGGGNVTFNQGDFQEGVKEGSNVYDGAIFSEIVEHLTDPKGGLNSLRNITKKGAKIFFTTATNAAFYDHTIIFKNVAEIEDLLKKSGFEIQESLMTPVFQSRQDIEVIEYSAILQNSGVMP
ncbi:MAG: class I SAM-dependent methyltransferase [Magnetococcales bacterium]|nr:class I SAM-dependent methyltransferase [Magnetococcales bacterium]